MSPRTRMLIDKARRAPPMTAEEMERQAIDFAWGNAAYENPRITKGLVRIEAMKLAAEAVVGRSLTTPESRSLIIAAIVRDLWSRWPC